MLSAQAVPVASPSFERFDLQRLAALAAVILDGGRERLSLSDGYRRVRLDVVKGTILAGPVTLTFLIPDDAALPARVQTMRQFQALRARGGFAGPLFKPEAHAAHWIRQLRALDAVEAGASERIIATVLFPGHEDWRGASDWVRSAVRRALRSGRRMVEGGYRQLIGQARNAPTVPGETSTS